MHDNIERYRTISFLPCPPRTKTQSHPRGPCSSLEQENGENDSKGETERGADEERGYGVIPLQGKAERSARALQPQGESTDALGPTRSDSFYAKPQNSL